MGIQKRRDKGIWLFIGGLFWPLFYLFKGFEFFSTPPPLPHPPGTLNPPEMIPRIIRPRWIYWGSCQIVVTCLVSFQLSDPLVWWVLIWYTKSEVILKVMPHFAHVFEAAGPRAEMGAGGGWAIRAGCIKFWLASMFGKSCILAFGVLFLPTVANSFLFWNAEASSIFLSGKNCAKTPRMGFKFCDTGALDCDAPKSWLRFVVADVKMLDSLSFALGRWFPIILSKSLWTNLCWWNTCSDVILSSSMLLLFWPCLQYLVKALMLPTEKWMQQEGLHQIAVLFI